MTTGNPQVVEVVDTVVTPIFPRDMLTRLVGMEALVVLVVQVPVVILISTP